MDFLSIGALILRSLQVISNNPALGGGSSVRMEEISELLGIFGQLFERGDEAIEELKAFADIVEAMAKEGRAPSRAEWDVLKGRSDTAHDTIQAAAAEPEPEPEEEETVVDDRLSLETLLGELLDIPEEDRTAEDNAEIGRVQSALDDLGDEE